MWRPDGLPLEESPAGVRKRSDRSVLRITSAREYHPGLLDIASIPYARDSMATFGGDELLSQQLGTYARAHTCRQVFTSAGKCWQERTEENRRWGDGRESWCVEKRRNTKFHKVLHKVTLSKRAVFEHCATLWSLVLLLFSVLFIS